MESPEELKQLFSERRMMNIMAPFEYFSAKPGATFILFLHLVPPKDISMYSLNT